MCFFLHINSKLNVPSIYVPCACPTPHHHMMQLALCRQILVGRNHICLYFMASYTFERSGGNQTKIWNKVNATPRNNRLDWAYVQMFLSYLYIYIYSVSICSSSIHSSTHLSIHHHPSSIYPFHSSFIYPPIFHPSINPPKKLWLSFNWIPVTLLGFLQSPQVKLFTYFPQVTFSLLGHQNSLENTTTQSTSWLPDFLMDHELSTI